VDSYPQSGHLSTIDQAQAGKVRRPKTDVLTTELRCQVNAVVVQ